MINSRKYKKKSKSFLSRRFFKIEILFFFSRLSISSNVIFERMQIDTFKNRHPGFLSHDRSWCAIDTRKKNKMERRSVVRCRCVVVHAACIVDDPSDWCLPNYPEHVVVFFIRVHSLWFPSPCSRRCFRFFLLCLLPKESEFFRFALELYFPCLSFLYSYVFRRKIRLKESFVELGFNFKDRWNNWLLVTRWRKFS